MATTTAPLDLMARDLVGDGKAPNLFFVSDRGNVVGVMSDPQVAYALWLGLASRSPRMESALEDRLNGVLASIERDEETGRMVRTDDAGRFIHEVA